MRQLQEAILQGLHLTVAEELSVPVSRPAASKAMLAHPQGIHPDPTDIVPLLRRARPVLLDPRPRRVVQEGQVCKQTVPDDS